MEKFKKTGSVHDQVKSGRPRSILTTKTIQRVKKIVEESSNLSVRQGARELDMTVSSYYKAIKEAGFHSFKPSTVIELSDDDFDRRIEFCQTMLVQFQNDSSLVNKIIWSDESKFMLSGVVNRHNCCYWAYSNPEIKIPVKNSRMGITVWCGLSSKGIIGPYFFEDTVTGESYLEMLENFLWPRVRTGRKYLQHDGAPAHYSQKVRNWLDKKFPNRWIGRRGQIEWPPRSPDLTPPDFFLWGYLKQNVYRVRPSTIAELRDKISHVCNEVDTGMCQRACLSVLSRLSYCLAINGRQVL